MDTIFLTDQRLKSYLDTNQCSRERLSLAVLALDRNFSQITPRQPAGGSDGGRDIQAVYRNELVVYGAVGFLNNANDSKEQIGQINTKFRDDVASAINAKEKAKAFVFLTNINLTVG